VRARGVRVFSSPFPPSVAHSRKPSPPLAVIAGGGGDGGETKRNIDRKSARGNSHTQR